MVENLWDIYLIFGVPKVIQHDQGPEFTSKVIDIDLCAWRITWSVSLILIMNTQRICSNNEPFVQIFKEFKNFHKQLSVDNRSTAPYHLQSNRLVEAHNKIPKMLINKMQYAKDTEWPNKHQPRVFSQHSVQKSTSYTPFRLMFGREWYPFGLLKLITGTEEDKLVQENITDDGLLIVFIV